MKKLIALTLMVACLACCSLGCKPKDKPKPTGTDSTATQPAGGETKPAGGETAPAKTE